MEREAVLNKVFNIKGVLNLNSYLLLQVSQGFLILFLMILSDSVQNFDEVAVLFAPVIVYILILSTIKRVRDLGISGWYYLVLIFIGFIPVFGIIFTLIVLFLPTDCLKDNKFFHNS